MKHILSVTGLAMILMACGNSSDTHSTHTTGDSANHSGHQAGGAAAVTDTAGTAGQSMMSLMQANMDEMKAVPSTGNPDNDFAAIMKVHHMGAVEMAQLLLAKGTDRQLKQMAQKILGDQQREIAELNTFLSRHKAHGGGDGFYKEVMSGMSNMKMEMDHQAPVDKQFAQMMIPHHEGAIAMARAYLKAGAHEEKLKAMANVVIKEQEKEIQQLQNWLSKKE